MVKFTVALAVLIALRFLLAWVATQTRRTRTAQTAATVPAPPSTSRAWTAALSSGLLRDEQPSPAPRIGGAPPPS